MKRAEAIETVLTVLDDELVVHANGFICRESFVLNDRPQNFYMIGSMGLAPSIGTWNCNKQTRQKGCHL